ncbi:MULTISPECIES: FG-GAP repeat protein [Streptomyces]|uniref:Uncharacterized protein n=1 Tax=Streptomyces fradiae TaxID=1906 RepID=A0ACC4WBD6_STRFR|nr:MULTISPECIES: FG-GAP repeat protein [Streptomyces]KNE81994.1 hypothetical protein ADZ36_13340 [Streptomyces fradiae]OFA51442.1 hypothetical protein BEN35_13945 [Streptomyces fradiae]
MPPPCDPAAAPLRPCGGPAATLRRRGGSSGLSGGTTVSDPNPSGHDRLGQSLAVGDITGDGRTDLAVGSTGKDVWIFTGGFTKSGGAASVDASHGTVFRQATEGVPGADESHDSFGGALAAGDVDGDDFPDLGDRCELRDHRLRLPHR